MFEKSRVREFQFYVLSKCEAEFLYYTRIHLSEVVLNIINFKNNLHYPNETCYLLCNEKYLFVVILHRFSPSVGHSYC